NRPDLVSLLTSPAAIRVERVGSSQGSVRLPRQETVLPQREEARQARRQGQPVRRLLDEPGLLEQLLLAAHLLARHAQVRGHRLLRDLDGDLAPPVSRLLADAPEEVGVACLQIQDVHPGPLRLERLDTALALL